MCFSLRRQYLPVSLLQIQRMVDLGRLDTTQPIDLTALCNTQIINLQIEHKQYGVNLTDEVGTEQHQTNFF